MNALPPIPDHRPAALRALGDLGTREGEATGATIADIATHAGLNPGDAWLACYQLQHLGLITSTYVNALSTSHWSLTPDGVALLANLGAQ
jgi:DNA-binding IclR family transcriptional regulator